MMRLLVAGVMAIALPGAVSATTSPGSPDRAFGTNGIGLTDIAGGSEDRCLEVAIDREEKIVCIGYTQPAGSQYEDVAVARYRRDGQLDSSFGSQGVATFDSGLSRDDLGTGGLLQPDGKIVVAGVADVPAGQDLLLVRFRADGSLDSGFGSGGFATTDGGPVEQDFDLGYAVAIQRDGKLVVAGQTSGRGGTDIALVRYTSDGHLDPSFGSGGKVQTDFGGGEIAYAVAIQPDGKIVVGGQGGHDGGWFAVARYLSSGRLDRSFGVRGVARTEIADAAAARALLLQRGGQILAVGWAGVGDDHLALVRYTAAGRLDARFGTRGRVVVKLAGAFTEVGGFATARQRDGKILVAGGTGGRPFVARYFANGRPDTAFGGTGMVTSEVQRHSRGWASALAVQADGRIVAAGASHFGLRDDIRPHDFALARFHAGGKADTRFARVQMRPTARGVLVSWRTTTEIGSRRFIVYREKWGRVTPVRPGRPARGSWTRGAAYAVLDRGAKPEELLHYWLEEEKRDGRRVRYGPFDP